MKLWIITLGFCNARTLEKGLGRLDEAGTIKNAGRIFLDQHYPLNREENLPKIIDICKRHGFGIIDSGHDRGLHRGFNYVTSLLPIEDDDFVLMYDPDCFPSAVAFDEVMVQVLNLNPKIQYVSLWNSAVERDIKSRVTGEFKDFSGILSFRYFIPNQIAAMNISMYRWRFIREIGGFSQPREYYGLLEEHLWNHLSARGDRMAFVQSIHNENPFGCSLADPEYTQYKLDHSGDRFKGSFAEWLKARI